MEKIDELKLITLDNSKGRERGGERRTNMERPQIQLYKEKNKDGDREGKYIKFFPCFLSYIELFFKSTHNH